MKHWDPFSSDKKNAKSAGSRLAFQGGAYSLAAAAILLAFAMLFGGLFLYARLDEPPVYPDTYTQVEGQTVLVPGEENPYYLRGTERKVYEVLYNLLPDGQGMQLLGGTMGTAQKIGEQAGYALLLAGAATALGLGCFWKKDLR